MSCSLSTDIGTYSVLKDKLIMGIWLGDRTLPPSACLWAYWDLSSVGSTKITTDTALADTSIMGLWFGAITLPPSACIWYS